MLDLIIEQIGAFTCDLPRRENRPEINLTLSLAGAPAAPYLDSMSFLDYFSEQFDQRHHGPKDQSNP
jgi:hypothetical protein